MPVFYQKQPFGWVEMQKKIKMFYEALSWDLPVDKINTLERFF